MKSTINKYLSKINPSLRSKIKFVAVISLLICILTLTIVALSSISGKPKEQSESTEQSSGLNTTVPPPTERKINDNKLKQTTEVDDSEVVREMSEMMETTPQASVANANSAYQRANQTASNFYSRSTVDREKIEMQSQIEELKRELRAKQQLPDNSLDDQIALIEKSYELATKYTGVPEPSTKSVVERATTTDERHSVSEVDRGVVSSLTNTGERGFNTAVSSHEEVVKNTFAASILSDQTVIGSETIYLRLIEPMMVGSIRLPEGTTITGRGSIGGERLHIAIDQVEFRGLIMPIKLTVIDSDGVEGIYIPNSREVSALKQIVANMGSSASSTISLSDQSAGEQILSDLGTGAITGVAQYASEKIKETKVHLKAGYRVMLYEKR